MQKHKLFLLKFFIIYQIVYSAHSEEMQCDTVETADEIMARKIEALIGNDNYLSEYCFYGYDHKNKSLVNCSFHIVPFNSYNIRETLADKHAYIPPKLRSYPDQNIKIEGVYFENAMGSNDYPELYKKFFLTTLAKTEQFHGVIFSAEAAKLTPIEHKINKKVNNFYGVVFPMLQQRYENAVVVALYGVFYDSLYESLNKIREQEPKPNYIFLHKFFNRKEDENTEFSEIEKGLKLFNEKIAKYGYFIATLSIRLNCKLEPTYTTYSSHFKSAKDFSSLLSNKSGTVTGICILLQKIK